MQLLILGLAGFLIVAGYCVGLDGFCPFLSSIVLVVGMGVPAGALDPFSVANHKRFFCFFKLGHFNSVTVSLVVEASLLFRLLHLIFRSPIDREARLGRALFQYQVALSRSAHRSPRDMAWWISRSDGKKPAVLLNSDLKIRLERNLSTHKERVHA